VCPNASVIKSCASVDAPLPRCGKVPDFEIGERSQNGILSTLVRRKESNARHGLGSIRSIVSSGNGVGIYANDISSDVLIRDGKCSGALMFEDWSACGTTS